MSTVQYDGTIITLDEVLFVMQSIYPVLERLRLGWERKSQKEKKRISNFGKPPGFENNTPLQQTTEIRERVIWNSANNVRYIYGNGEGKKEKHLWQFYASRKI
jgi:hypothetical protein